MTSVAELYTQAMELDEAERTELADRLYESLNGDVTPEWEKAWAAELERRDAEHLAGTDPDIPWDEAMQRIFGAIDPQ
ncbi:MAG TPA: addiction module protein [Tepidiformaceae bacterium]|nr:addiction module protein [Tepidiformaceae bacterium]